MMETCLSRVTGSSPALALVRIIPFSLIFLLGQLPLGGADCPRRWAGFMAGWRLLCVGRNASYVYEIDYCAIGAGSQKVCR